MRHPVQVFRPPPSRAQRRPSTPLCRQSEPEQFTSRLIVNTGGSIQKNALKTLEASPKPCRVLDQAELDGWDVDWLAVRGRSGEPAVSGPRTLHAPSLSERCRRNKCWTGFEEQDRGQLILPCGTGKTAVTLWIAEQQVGLGGRVLYLVPSISLMAQTMREWSEQKSLPLRYVGICSDTRAGRNDEGRLAAGTGLPRDDGPREDPGRPAGRAAGSPHGRLLHLPVTAPGGGGTGRRRAGL